MYNLMVVWMVIELLISPHYMPFLDYGVFPAATKQAEEAVCEVVQIIV